VIATRPRRRPSRTLEDTGVWLSLLNSRLCGRSSRQCGLLAEVWAVAVWGGIKGMRLIGRLIANAIVAGPPFRDQPVLIRRRGRQPRHPRYLRRWRGGGLAGDLDPPAARGGLLESHSPKGGGVAFSESYIQHHTVRTTLVLQTANLAIPSDNRAFSYIRLHRIEKAASDATLASAYSRASHDPHRLERSVNLRLAARSDHRPEALPRRCVRARLRLEVRVEGLGPSLGGRVGGIFGSSVGKVGRFGSGLGEGQL
jgi:hypothetical protein